ncbi:MAG: glycosyltransferase family 2 protein [Phycicoccus sp.]|nr:glycosyltransferase family 2 protein [Phycicoccus sp.]
MSGPSSSIPQPVAISIVVPHYGDPEPTEQLIDQLMRQRHPQIQVIVADDASPRPFPQRPGVEVIRRATNGGFGTNVNTGVTLARHELLLILNSDVIIDEDFVANLITAAEPWLPAVVSPRVTGATGRDEWIGRRFPSIGQQVIEWLHPLAGLRSKLHWAVGHDPRARGRTATVDWVVGAAMLLPTATFRAVGGFDESFFMNSEEVDLQRRLRQRGVLSVVVAEPHLIHEGGGSSPNARRRRWLVQSRLAYTQKWSGAGGRRRLTAALLAASSINLAWNCGRSLLGRDVHPVSTFHEEVGLLRAIGHSE